MSLPLAWASSDNPLLRRAWEIMDWARLHKYPPWLIDAQIVRGEDGWESYVQRAKSNHLVALWERLVEHEAELADVELPPLPPKPPPPPPKPTWVVQEPEAPATEKCWSTACQTQVPRTATDPYCDACRTRISAKAEATLRRKAELGAQDLQPRDWHCVVCRVTIATQVRRPDPPALCVDCLETHFHPIEETDEAWPEGGLAGVDLYGCPQVARHTNRRGEMVVYGHVMRHAVRDRSDWDTFGETAEYADDD